MRKIFLIIIFLFILGVACSRLPSPAAENKTQPPVISFPTIMQITSPAFGQNEIIPAKYTCDGENISPPLQISGVPNKAVSLALIVDDPDAPAGIWTHWTVWNIPVETLEIPENGLPAGAREGLTSFGKTGYGGPCPPSGTHRYFFKLYALDASLNLAPSAPKDEVEKAIEGHLWAQTELIGLYQR